MKQWNITALGVWGGLVVCLTSGGIAPGADETNTENRLRLLQEQNDALQTQVRKQQELIDGLSREMAEIRKSGAKAEPDTASSGPGNADSTAASSPGGSGFGKLQITGEGGVAFFESGANGQYPNSEFRVNEAKLFFDAPVWGDAYAFAEVNLATPESSSLNVQLGELYLDVEDISKLWGRERQLNLRAGRMDIPFGEEYLRRDVIDNPLVSDSLSDIWGIDEGLELYGALGKFSYAAAVMNGSVLATHDFDADKAVVGRVSYDANRWLHLSASAMRTGDLNAQRDYLSEVWFGNWWFEPLGSTNTTRFHANLLEGDVVVRLPRGRLSAFGGYVHYNDNDPGVNNARDVYYYCVEAVHDIAHGLYGAARFSQILAEKGFPIVGNGDMSYNSRANLTKDLWLLSLGLGYRWNPHLVLKAEYSIEQGKELDGTVRKHENLFAVEAAFAF